MKSFGLKYRRGVEMGDEQQNEGLQTPEDIERWDDISYGSYGKWNLLDVYRPKEQRGKLPVIINVHGGGWVAGSKEAAQFYCMFLAGQGFAVINPSYRLAPEYQWPAGIEDLNCIVCWMFKQEEFYGFDTKHVFLTGDSAGGNMAAVYACICTNDDYATQYDFMAPNQFVPTALALNCGVYNMPKNRLGLLGLLMKDLLGKGYKKKNLMAMSPCFYITENFPPSYLMTATGDFMRKDPKYMIREFKKKNVQYRYKVYGTKEKRLPHVFHVNIRTPEAEECNMEECNFFKSFLE